MSQRSVRPVIPSRCMLARVVLQENIVSAGFRAGDAAFGPGYRLFLTKANGVLKVQVSSPYRVAPALRPLTCKVLMYLNFALQEGNMEMDVRDGEVRFRASNPATVPINLRVLVALGLELGCITYNSATNEMIKFIEGHAADPKAVTHEELLEFAAKTSQEIGKLCDAARA